MKWISIPKIEEGAINEDAVNVSENFVAISDGAGGGGVFADLWSQYLVDHITTEPISNFRSFDKWIDDIWEVFYNECEARAQKDGGMLLNKFYDEGSFATLVAIWKLSDSSYQWISYGDSVAFHYNYHTKKLEYSYCFLSDFDKPPYLINCKDELNEEGFRQGIFNSDRNSIIFATSDALAHYIIMMYQICHQDVYKGELSSAIQRSSRNSNYIQTAINLGNFDFEDKVINKLQKSIGCRINFIRHTRKLIKEGLLAYDDYSIGILKNDFYG